MSDQLIAALIGATTALIVNIIGYFLVPIIQERRQRKRLRLERRISTIDRLYEWVREHLIVSTLLYFSASETYEVWLSSVVRYEESDAARAHARALAKRLEVNELLPLMQRLIDETKKLLLLAQEKRNLPVEDRDNPELKARFETVEEQATQNVSEIYEILDNEIIKLLGLKGLLRFF